MNYAIDFLRFINEITLNGFDISLKSIVTL